MRVWCMYRLSVSNGFTVICCSGLSPNLENCPVFTELMSLKKQPVLADLGSFFSETNLSIGHRKKLQGKTQENHYFPGNLG